MCAVLDAQWEGFHEARREFQAFDLSKILKDRSAFATSSGKTNAPKQS